MNFDCVATEPCIEKLSVDRAMNGNCRTPENLSRGCTLYANNVQVDHLSTIVLERTAQFSVFNTLILSLSIVLIPWYLAACKFAWKIGRDERQLTLNIRSKPNHARTQTANLLQIVAPCLRPSVLRAKLVLQDWCFTHTFQTLSENTKKDRISLAIVL